MLKQISLCNETMSQSSNKVILKFMKNFRSYLGHLELYAFLDFIHIMCVFLYTLLFMCPHKNKSNRLRSGDLGGYHIMCHYYLGTADSVLVLRNFREILIIEDLLEFHRNSIYCPIILLCIISAVTLSSSGIEYDTLVLKVDFSQLITDISDDLHDRF